MQQGKGRGKVSVADAVQGGLSESARAAVAAVDAAVRKLPPAEELKFSIMEEGGFSAFGGDRAPSNPGSKVPFEP